MLRTKVCNIFFVIIVISGLLPTTVVYGLSTNNPRWLVETGGLGAGQTLLTYAKASGAVQKLEVGENPVACRLISFSLEKAGKPLEHDLKGSSTPSPGTGAQSILFGNCEVEGSSSCTINGGSAGHATIETEPLKDTLVYKSKAAAELEESKTLTLLEPQGKLFAVVKFSGTCPETGEIKAGEEKILGENEQGALGEALQESHVITFPTLLINVYYKNVGGKTEEVKLNEKKGLGCLLLGLAIGVYVAVVIWGFW